VSTLSARQRTQHRRAEFVRTDPAGPAHPVTEPGEADRDVGSGYGKAEVSAQP
jgi:hypothetical protein